MGFLAGLIDGDGHFNKLGNLIVTFDLNNVRTAYKIKSYLRYGTVSMIKDKKACKYVLSHPVGLKWRDWYGTS